MDAAVIVLENIYRQLQAADAERIGRSRPIADATGEAVRPVLFSVLVIIVALIPLFTMEGVPGKIFGADVRDLRIRADRRARFSRFSSRRCWLHFANPKSMARNTTRAW